MQRGVFWDNHKKYVLWMIDIAKLLAVVCGATLLGTLFVKVGFPETNIVIIYIFAVLLVARFTKGYFYGILSSVVVFYVLIIFLRHLIILWQSMIRAT